MKIVRTIAQLDEALAGARDSRATVGFVPTMGALHRGHLSLVERSRAECDVTVVSIFVNPLQFAPMEDLAAYPRDLDRDAAALRRARADVLFAPDVATMYPPGFQTSVEVAGLSEGLCGAKRPGHFRGVTTVVARLLGLVRPRRAYFGQKDAQQAVVVRRMVSDLALGVEIVVCPIVRDADGLALSSRNAYLSTAERRVALALPKGIGAAQGLFARGERRAEALRRAVLAVLDLQPHLFVDYVEVVDACTLSPIERISGPALVAAAVRVGRTRLIDNAIVGGPPVKPRPAPRARSPRPGRSRP